MIEKSSDCLGPHNSFLLQVNLMRVHQHSVSFDPTLNTLLKLITITMYACVLISGLKYKTNTTQYEFWQASQSVDVFSCISHSSKENSKVEMNTKVWKNSP